MQKCRSTLWDIVRAYFMVLNRMPYEKPKSSRVLPPARPDPSVTPRTTVADFLKDKAPGCGTHELFTWHVENGVPFATEAFDVGLYETFNSRSYGGGQMVLKLTGVAFWLFGVETPLKTGKPLTKSGGQNDQGVRWYHSRIRAWARVAILSRTPERGPWWKARHRAWAFRQNALVLISDDGIDLGFNDAVEAP
ncbi:unnamed protein product [Closterium sp. NIES-64]|nr:unnamed protein product [Closterium sp. NIES-64]